MSQPRKHSVIRDELLVFSEFATSSEASFAKKRTTKNQ
jgi:hypothetical protein